MRRTNSFSAFSSTSFDFHLHLPSIPDVNDDPIDKNILDPHPSPPNTSPPHAPNVYSSINNKPRHAHESSTPTSFGPIAAPSSKPSPTPIGGRSSLARHSFSVYSKPFPPLSMTSINSAAPSSNTNNSSASPSSTSTSSAALWNWPSNSAAPSSSPFSNLPSLPAPMHSLQSTPHPIHRRRVASFSEPLLFPSFSSFHTPVSNSTTAPTSSSSSSSYVSNPMASIFDLSPSTTASASAYSNSPPPLTLSSPLPPQSTAGVPSYVLSTPTSTNNVATSPTLSSSSTPTPIKMPRPRALTFSSGCPLRPITPISPNSTPTHFPSLPHPLQAWSIWSATTTTTAAPAPATATATAAPPPAHTPSSAHTATAAAAAISASPSTATSAENTMTSYPGTGTGPDAALFYAASEPRYSPHPQHRPRHHSVSERETQLMARCALEDPSHMRTSEDETRLLKTLRYLGIAEDEEWVPPTSSSTTASFNKSSTPPPPRPTHPTGVTSGGAATAVESANSTKQPAAAAAHISPTHPCSRALWVGHLPPHFTVQQLSALFSPFGPIDSCRILTHKQCGFVNFVNASSALAASLHMKHQTIMGYPIRIGFAKVPTAPPKQPTGIDVNTTLLTNINGTLVSGILLPSTSSTSGASSTTMAATGATSAAAAAAAAASSAASHAGHASGAAGSATASVLSSTSSATSNGHFAPTATGDAEPEECDTELEPLPNVSVFDPQDAIPEIPRLHEEMSSSQLKGSALASATTTASGHASPVLEHKWVRQYQKWLDSVGDTHSASSEHSHGAASAHGSNGGGMMVADEANFPHGEEVVKFILDECRKDLVALALDYVGNTVLQKLIEKVMLQDRLDILHHLAPSLPGLAVHKHGTWVVQKCIELAHSDLEIQILVTSLQPYTTRLLLDPFGNYVLQCCLRLQHHAQFIFDALVDHCVWIAQGKFGARAMRACLEHANCTWEQKRRVAQAILTHSNLLATHVHGTLLVTWLLDCTQYRARYAALLRQVHVLPLLHSAIGLHLLLKLVSQRAEPEVQSTLVHALWQCDITALARTYPDGLVPFLQKLVACLCDIDLRNWVLAQCINEGLW